MAEKYTPKEILDLTESRAKSDRELLKGGAEFDGTHLEPTESQKKDIESRGNEALDLRERLKSFEWDDAIGSLEWMAEAIAHEPSEYGLANRMEDYLEENLMEAIKGDDKEKVAEYTTAIHNYAKGLAIKISPDDGDGYAKLDSHDENFAEYERKLIQIKSQARKLCNDFGIYIGENAWPKDPRDIISLVKMARNAKLYELNQSTGKA